MRAIETSPWLKKPGLTVIHSPDKPSADKNDTDQLSDFTLRATQENTNTDIGVINEPIRH